MIRLFTTLILSTTLLSRPALAKNCRVLDVFSDDMTLSQTQIRMHQDLTEVYKEKSKMTKDFHASRLELLSGILQHSTTPAEAQRLMQDSLTNRIDQDNEVVVLSIELLNSFSDKQRDQFKNNLETQQVCFTEFKANKERSRPKIGKMLFENLELSEEQRTLLVEIWHDRQVFSAPSVYGLQHEDLIVESLNGPISAAAASTRFELKATDQTVFRDNEVEALFELLDSLTEQQRQQFLANIRKVQSL